MKKNMIRNSGLFFREVVVILLFVIIISLTSKTSAQKIGLNEESRKKLVKTDQLYEKYYLNEKYKNWKKIKENGILDKYLSLEKKVTEDSLRCKIKARIGILDFLRKKYRYAWQRLSDKDCEKITPLIKEKEIGDQKLFKILSYIGSSDPVGATTKEDIVVFRVLSKYMIDRNRPETLPETLNEASKKEDNLLNGNRILLLKYLKTVANHLLNKGNYRQAFYMYATLDDVINKHTNSLKGKNEISRPTREITDALFGLLDSGKNGSNKLKFLMQVRGEILRQNPLMELVEIKEMMLSGKLDGIDDAISDLGDANKINSIPQPLKRDYVSRLAKLEVLYYNQYYKKTGGEKKQMEILKKWMHNELLSKEDRKKFADLHNKKEEAHKQEAQRDKIDEELKSADNLFSTKKYKEALETYLCHKNHLFENGMGKRYLKVAECYYKLKNYKKLLEWTDQILGNEAVKSGLDKKSLASVHYLRGRSYKKEYKKKEDISILEKAYDEHLKGLNLDNSKYISAYYVALFGDYILKNKKFDSKKRKQMKENVINACGIYIRETRKKKGLKKFIDNMEKIRGDWIK